MPLKLCVKLLNVELGEIVLWLETYELTMNTKELVIHVCYLIKTFYIGYDSGNSGKILTVINHPKNV